jgi:hypothetical protein
MYQRIMLITCYSSQEEHLLAQDHFCGGASLRFIAPATLSNTYARNLSDSHPPGLRLGLWAITCHTSLISVWCQTDAMTLIPRQRLAPQNNLKPHKVALNMALSLGQAV